MPPWLACDCVSWLFTVLADDRHWGDAGGQWPLCLLKLEGSRRRRCLGLRSLTGQQVVTRLHQEHLVCCGGAPRGRLGNCDHPAKHHVRLKCFFSPQLLISVEDVWRHVKSRLTSVFWLDGGGDKIFAACLSGRMEGTEHSPRANERPKLLWSGLVYSQQTS